MEYEFILCVRESIYISRENFYAFGLESTKLDEEFHLECRHPPHPPPQTLLVGCSFTVPCQFDVNFYIVYSVIFLHVKKFQIKQKKTYSYFLSHHTIGCPCNCIYSAIEYIIIFFTNFKYSHWK